jgi:hypothetical protein
MGRHAHTVTRPRNSTLSPANSDDVQCDQCGIHPMPPRQATGFVRMINPPAIGDTIVTESSEYLQQDSQSGWDNLCYTDWREYTKFFLTTTLKICNAGHDAGNGRLISGMICFYMYCYCTLRSAPQQLQHIVNKQVTENI